MGDAGDGREETGFATWEKQSNSYALSSEGIAEQNQYLLDRYRQFRCAADAVTTALRKHREVTAVALIGSLAIAPWKEVPRFSPYRRAGIELWHECKDIDLAVWLSSLADLNGLRRSKDQTLRQLLDETGIGVASHQLDIFILEPGTDHYFGRLCGFNKCPKGKRDCLVPGCGASPFLKQHENFVWRPGAIAEDRMVALFRRDDGAHCLAADLALPWETY